VVYISETHQPARLFPCWLPLCLLLQKLIVSAFQVERLETYTTEQMHFKATIFRLLCQYVEELIMPNTIRHKERKEAWNQSYDQVGSSETSRKGRNPSRNPPPMQLRPGKFIPMTSIKPHPIPCSLSNQTNLIRFSLQKIPENIWYHV
jgi:hypothetical protein